MRGARPGEPRRPAGAHLVQVVVGFSLLQAEGLPERGRQPSQQLVEDVVVPLVFGLQSGCVSAERGPFPLGDPHTHTGPGVPTNINTHSGLQMGPVPSELSELPAWLSLGAGRGGEARVWWWGEALGSIQSEKGAALACVLATCLCPRSHACLCPRRRHRPPMAHLARVAEHSLCAWPCSRPWDTEGNKADPSPWPHRPTCLLGDRYSANQWLKHKTCQVVRSALGRQNAVKMRVHFETGQLPCKADVSGRWRKWGLATGSGWLATQCSGRSSQCKGLGSVSLVCFRDREEPMCCRA